MQRLDQYRAIATAALIDLEWEEASTRLLPATDLTIAGIVKHLAWAEDRWFQGRLLGTDACAWDVPGADDPDHAMRLASGDSVAGILELYSSACEPKPLRARPVRLTQRRRGGPLVRDRTGQPSLDPRSHDRRDRSPRRSPRSPPGPPQE